MNVICWIAIASTQIAESYLDLHDDDDDDDDDDDNDKINAWLWFGVITIPTKIVHVFSVHESTELCSPS